MEKHKSVYKELLYLPTFWKMDLGIFIGAPLVMNCLVLLKLIAPKYLALMLCLFSIIEGIIMYIAAATGKPRGPEGIASRTNAYSLFIFALAFALFYSSLSVETPVPIPTKWDVTKPLNP